MGLLEQMFGLENPQTNQPNQFGQPGTPTQNSFLSGLINKLAQSRAGAMTAPQQGPPMPPQMMPNLSGGGPQPQTGGPQGPQMDPMLLQQLLGASAQRSPAPYMPGRTRMPFDIPMDGQQGGQGGALANIAQQLPQQGPIPQQRPGPPIFPHGVTPPGGTPWMMPMAPPPTPEELHQRELDQRFPLTPNEWPPATGPSYWDKRRSVQQRGGLGDFAGLGYNEGHRSEIPGSLWQERRRRST